MEVLRRTDNNTSQQLFVIFLVKFHFRIIISIFSQNHDSFAKDC